jgi:hypothetical protein
MNGGDVSAKEELKGSAYGCRVVSVSVVREREREVEKKGNMKERGSESGKGCDWGSVGHFRLVSQLEGCFVVEHEEDAIMEVFEGKIQARDAEVRSVPSVAQTHTLLTHHIHRVLIYWAVKVQSVNPVLVHNLRSLPLLPRPSPPTKLANCGWMLINEWWKKRLCVMDGMYANESTFYTTVTYMIGAMNTAAALPSLLRKKRVPRRLGRSRSRRNKPGRITVTT